MKSFCIKTNSNQKKNFLLQELEQMQINEFYISFYEFKIFKNIIIHYKGKDLINFQKELSEKIANTVVKFYDEELLNRIIRKNYFYLEEDEQNVIKRISYKILISNQDNDNFSKEILRELIYDYINDNKKMILDGFVNFRIKEYIETLDYIVELAVISYLNFIDLR